MGVYHVSLRVFQFTSYPTSFLMRFVGLTLFALMPYLFRFRYFLNEKKAALEEEKREKGKNRRGRRFASWMSLVGMT